jgi:aspartate/methionine/tyrosine aminotransferase
MPSTFTPFALERFMSRFEQDVGINLSESGVHPVTLGELLALGGTAFEDLASLSLDYPHVEGIPRLREHIAGLYPGASPADVLVTVGAIEANLIATRTLVGPGDGIAVMVPNYLQVWGLARNEGADLRTFRLHPEEDWTLDVDELEAVVTPQTRLIAVCNPNNPTGRVLTPSEMEAVVAAADRVGAWILADEVYRGAERATDEETPTFFGRYDRVIAVGSMSKAYGLPGLRVGWAVTDPALVDEIWARHEYTTISATMLANHLAALALDSSVRPRLLERTRGFIRRGFPILERWLQHHAGLLEARSPDAAAIAFVRYHRRIESAELAGMIRDRAGVLVVPGVHFGEDHHLRVSYGLPEDQLTAGLEGIGRVLEEIPS